MSVRLMGHKLFLTCVTAMSLVICSVYCDLWHMRSPTIHLIKQAYASTVTPTFGFFKKAATGKSDNLWVEIRKGFKLDHHIKRKEVKHYIRWYQKHPEYITMLVNQSEPYLYHVTEQVRARGLPAELVLLPMIESAYDPTAHSGVGASGLWQFMPRTARTFGIKRTWWYDGRRDVFASTVAALDYLEYLDKFFHHDWTLAISAYDSGEGTVRKSVKRNKAKHKPTDFWSLKLPKETQNYLPRLLALACIVENPSLYGITLKPVKNEAYLTKVDVGHQMAIATIAELANMDPDKLAEYNPGLNRLITNKKGPHMVIMPVPQVAKFKKNYANLPNHKQREWYRYKTSRGDTLAKIAKLHDTDPLLVKHVNKLTSHRLRPGKILVLPKPISNTMHANQQKSSSPAIGNNTVYIVAEGDNLWTIAKTLRVSADDLLNWNPKLSDKSFLHPGDPLIIRTVSNPESYFPKHKQQNKTKRKRKTVKRTKIHKGSDYYTVKSGDNLWTIAKKHHMSHSALVELNQNRPIILKPGQQIRIAKTKPKARQVKPLTKTIPKTEGMKTVIKETTKTHRIKSGESLYVIARANHTSIDSLMKANNLKSKTLRVGKTLKLPS